MNAARIPDRKATAVTDTTDDTATGRIAAEDAEPGTLIVHGGVVQRVDLRATTGDGEVLIWLGEDDRSLRDVNIECAPGTLLRLAPPGSAPGDEVADKARDAEPDTARARVNAARDELNAADKRSDARWYVDEMPVDDAERAEGVLRRVELLLLTPQGAANHLLTTSPTSP